MTPRIIGEVAPGVHFTNFTDSAIPERLANQPDAFAGVALVAHLSGDLVLVGGGREGAGFGDVVGERFLAINMFAGLHGGHGNHRMRMIRRCDNDRVDVFLFVQHLAVIRPDPGVGIFLERVGGIIMVHIAQCDDVLRPQVFQVAAPHAAHADARNVQLLAGSSPFGAQHMAGQDVESCDGQGAGAQEAAAGHGCAARGGGLDVGGFHKSSR